jgi:hypothetical protein
MAFFGGDSYYLKIMKLKLTKSEQYSLICQLWFFAGGGWRVVEERNYLEAPS